MTLAQALAQAAAQGLDRLDAELLLLHVLGRPHQRAWLRVHDGDALGTQAQMAWQALVDRRLAGEPVAYLVGEQEFFGLPLQVDARVLIPRPDTETLVEWALQWGDVQGWRVADLGTGSGAIALALKHARPGWELHAVDASADALAVAAANANRLGLGLSLHQGHWLQALDGRFDLIVSNPPYIAEGDVHLPALRHEPASALVAGPQGLDDLRCIVAQAGSRLHGGGWLLLEHGHDQAQAVAQLLHDAGFLQVQSRQDLAGIVRCTGGQWLMHGPGPVTAMAQPR